MAVLLGLLIPLGYKKRSTMGLKEYRLGTIWKGSLGSIVLTVKKNK
jgi:hypothetical protein